MAMYAFRRLREREALATAGASFSNAEPVSKLEVATPQLAPTDSDHASQSRRNGGRRKRQLLSDAGSSGTDH